MPPTNVAALHPSASVDKANRPAVAGVGIRTAQDIVTGPAAATALTGLFNSYAPLAYMLPFQALDYIELIAQYNSDYSQAVENIKTLANSGHALIINGASQRKTADLRSRFEDKARTIQERHGGIDGLIDKLLNQAATYGAMCGEWVLNEQLDDVIDFADVNPKNIRFFFEDNHWAPYQRVTWFQLEEAMKLKVPVKMGMYVKLNELTFHYYAFNAAPQNPYGVPPFLAALPHVAVQQDMLFNMAQVVKKVGLLGIVDIAVEQMQMLPGETPAAFGARAKGYLEEYASSLSAMMEEGGIAHFNDSTIKATNISGNAAGATNIFKQNEELLFSGLKSMPSVQGRSYSTTETYAGVAYDIIIRNTKRYQRAAKRMIESGYWLMATVWGETPSSITLQFEENKTLQRLEIAKAERLEIINSAMKWVMGLLDQQGVAQELGYSEVATVLTEPPIDNRIFGVSPAGNKAAEDDEEPLAIPHTSSMDEAGIRSIVETMLHEVIEEMGLHHLATVGAE